MKRKALEQLRNKAAADLTAELQKKKDSLWDLLVDLRAGKVKNVRGVRSLKQEIAIIQTLIKEKQHV